MKKYLETKYFVYPEGKVQNGKSGRFLSHIKAYDGYIHISMTDKSFNTKNHKKHVFLHRMVAELYIPNPENKKEVNHKDGNKNNNCVDNLEWVTPKENQAHSYLTGIAKSGCNHKKASLNKEQVDKARSLAALGVSVKDIAVQLNASRYVIRDVVKNRSYKKEYGW